MPIISITIQKGGGAYKTTTTVNLAAFLRNQEKKVLKIDDHRLNAKLPVEEASL